MIKPIFWSEIYCSLNNQSKIQSVHELEGKPLEFIFIYEHEGKLLKSPGKATFGGIWVLGGHPTINFYKNIYQSIIENFEEISSVKVVLPPEFFYPQIFKSQAEALKEIGFKLLYSDINFHIDLNRWSQKEMSKGNRKKIRQFCEAGGIINVSLEDEYFPAYNLLKHNRENRGAKISMNADTFIRNLEELPDSYKLYVAKIENQLAAVAYVVRISPDVNYVLFWGDEIRFRQLSPVASLLNYLVPLCKIDGYKTLDLGISSVDGILDNGLARFKKNLGAQETFKPIFELTIYR